MKYPEHLYPKNDLVRPVVYEDITAVILGIDLPKGPIFEYGPSVGIYQLAMPGRENIVRNWPDVDCMKKDYPDESLSCIIADYTLEHLSRPWVAAQCSYDMLKPGGIAVYTTHWMFPDHTGDQEEDYWRFTPKGLRVLFSMFSSTYTGCWGDGHLAGKFIELNSQGYDKLLREYFPEYSDEQIANAKNRIYAVTTWVVAVK